MVTSASGHALPTRLKKCPAVPEQYKAIASAISCARSRRLGVLVSSCDSFFSAATTSCVNTISSGFTACLSFAASIMAVRIVSRSARVINASSLLSPPVIIIRAFNSISPNRSRSSSSSSLLSEASKDSSTSNKTILPSSRFNIS